MSYRSMMRLLKSPQRPVYRPQVIRLEERLPLGDALLSPLLAASWLGARGPISEAESPRVLKKDSLAGLSVATENGDFLWVGEFNDGGAVGAIDVTPRPPVSSGLADAVDISTAPTTAVRGNAGNLSERPVSLAETLGAAHGTESTSLTPYFGRSGRVENRGLLQALASVQLAGHERRSPAPKEQVQANYGKLPLSFEANVGQTDPSVQFLAHGPGYGLYLTGTEAVMVVSQPVAHDSFLAGKSALGFNSTPQDPAGLNPGPQALASPPPQTTAVVRMQVLGGNATPRVMGEDPLPGKVNYFLGNDPLQWHSNISTFGKVEYQQVYPGIDLVYYGSGQQLEYDFVVGPGADPSTIRLGFTGADGVELNGHGDLMVHAGGQDILQHRPTVYQEVNGTRQEIASQFTLIDTPFSSLAPPQVAFQLALFDTSRPLVIDPVLSYSTYLGGSASDTGYGIAADSAGNTYVTGYTYSTNFPTTPKAFQNTGGGDFSDVFVAKFNPTGSTLLYSSYLGGSSHDVGLGIATDTAGDAYVTGYTWSTNFPTVNPIQRQYGGGFQDAFVTKLNPTGSRLAYSTYLGGGDIDVGWGIAVDPAGNAYVGGYTYSTNFPTTPGAFQTALHGQSAGFVAKLNAAGKALVYSTYVGGSGTDLGSGIAADAAGNAYLTGLTYSNDFPTMNPFQGNYNGNNDAFVTKINPSGSALVYSSYLGGSGLDEAYGISLDPSGAAYVVGLTYSTDFPTTPGAFQPTGGGLNPDAFVAKVTPSGSALAYSSYLGGSDADYAYGVAVDRFGSAYVTGFTSSADFPVVEPFQALYGGQGDAFVAKVNASGSALVYSSYLGGNGPDQGRGIALGSKGTAFVTGFTGSFNFPTVNPFQRSNGGLLDVFVTKISEVITRP